MTVRTGNFRPSRILAAEAVKPPVTPPEPITARARRQLSEPAKRDRLQQELAYLYGSYIPSPDQKACEEAVRHQLEAAEFSLSGARDSLYVLGRPGSGKSTAVRTAALAYHRRRLEEAGLAAHPDPTWQKDGYVADLVPAIMMTVRAEARNKAFVAQIVDFLGYEVGNLTAPALANRIPGLAERHGVGLLVADDVHNLADLGREKDAIHNAIKNINTELGYLNVCSIYIGNPDESGFGNLYANLQLDQRLIPFWFNDMPLDLRATDESFESVMWWEYLHDWEEALRLVLPDLGLDDLSSGLGRKLWFRCKGSVGGLAGLLKRAAANQLRSGAPRSQLTLTGALIDMTPMPERFNRRGH